MEPRRVLFLWSRISGYMAACWEALRQRGQCLPIVVTSCGAEHTAFAKTLMNTVEWYDLAEDERKLYQKLSALIEETKPHVVVASGWWNRIYIRALVRYGRQCATILALDNAWQGTIRQLIGQYPLRWLARMFDVAVVPGERALQYARRLGFSWERIMGPLYGIDFETFAAAAGQGVERRPYFVFVGRYVEEKGVRCLLQAYERYRCQVDEPWALVMCGAGPLAKMISAVEGVEDRGFLQPRDLAEELAAASAFVLSSRQDNWGVAIVEACAAGLPIIATKTCGATVECVRDGWNGLLVPPDDVEALARALCAIHHAEDRLEKGRRSAQLARPYAAAHWAEAWERIVESALARRRASSPELVSIGPRSVKACS